MTEAGCPLGGRPNDWKQELETMDETNESVLKMPLIVGNWKMNNNITDSIKLLTALKNLIKGPLHTEVVLAPPHTSLYSVAVANQETSFKLAGQNCYWEDEGPFTGEVSALFLKDIGCDYVILGHSERRTLFGETDEMINKKIHAALNADVIPIFCVGESHKERENKKTFEVIEKQLRKGLSDVTMHDLENFVIAYEPVWAIGTGNNASPAQANEVHSFIRNFMGKLYDAPTANNIRILYGGSVKTSNIKDLLKAQDVNGVLVGGASLHAEEFSKIIQFAD